MYRRIFRAEFTAPMSIVFSALIAELAAQRWSLGLHQDVELPRAGQRYRHRGERGRRQGRVLEIRPPLGITLREAMVIGNCRLDQHLRFMLSPGEHQTAVVVGVRYQPDGLARLRIEAWHRWLLKDQKATLVRVDRRLREQTQDAAVIGHSQGSTSMTVANITRVRGKPIFR